MGCVVVEEGAAEVEPAQPARHMDRQRIERPRIGSPENV